MTPFLIFVSDGRFPRAWLQSPRRFASAGPLAHAIPAGVAVFHYNPSPTINASSQTVCQKIRIVKVSFFYPKSD